MGELLDRQYQYYLQNKQMLLDKYEGKYIVIHNEELVGTFNSERDAYVYCVSHFKMGTFFMQQLEG